MHLLLLLISIVLIAIGITRLRSYSKSRSWVKVKGELTEFCEKYKEVALSEYTRVKYYYPSVKYSYKYNNETYTSDAVSPHIRNIWVCEVDNYGIEIPKEKRFWYSWQPNMEIDIYVNKHDPSVSFIEKAQSKQHKSHNYAIFASGIIIFVLWALATQLPNN